MNWLGIVAIFVIVVSAGLMILFTFLHGRTPPVWREISAFSRLRRAIGLSVEDGTRLHFSLGRSNLIEPGNAAALAALNMLQQVTEKTSVADLPPVVTVGDSSLLLLSQDTLQSAYRTAAAQDQYDPTTGRITGFTPFAYAAGAIPEIRDEQTSANIFAGHFGVEVGLLTGAAERQDTFTMAATDDLTAQAVLYATVKEPLIGEELFATGAYVGTHPIHHASLRVQDILRWVVIVAIIAGSLLKVLGIL